MNDLTHVSDVLPTMLSAAKCHTLPPKVLDGHDLWSRLEGDSLGQDEKRKEIIMQINPLLRLWEEDTRFQNSTWDTRTQGWFSSYQSSFYFIQGVIIDGDYKLIVGSHSVLRRKASDYQTVWLFNIKNDPQEANDLRFDLPDTQSGILNICILVARNQTWRTSCFIVFTKKWTMSEIRGILFPTLHQIQVTFPPKNLPPKLTLQHSTGIFGVRTDPTSRSLPQQIQKKTTLILLAGVTQTKKESKTKKFEKFEFQWRKKLADRKSLSVLK